MPVYNAGSFLVPAIESIFNQTFTDFELIIIDDNSTDQSWKIIQKYQRKYPKKIISRRMPHTLNCGGDSCANMALKEAKGTYIARMDADDIAHPTRFAKQVTYLESHPGIFLVGSNAYVIDKNGEIIGNKLEPSTSQDIYKSYVTFHPLIHPSTMYRRIYKNIQFFYDIKYSANNDYYTFFTLICKGYKFKNLQEKLMYYRIHETNDTFVHIKEKFFNTVKIRLTMVLKYHYKITFKQFLTTIIQGIILLVLPERLTKYIYLLSKGILKLENPFRNRSYSLRFSVTK